jgi:hypothetical protein
LIIAGVAHLLPLAGVLGVERLSGMYGVPIASHDIEILMRHRAVLFGLLGLFLAGAAFKSEWRGPAFVAGGASMMSFIWLAWAVGGFNDAVRRIVLIDATALAVLSAAAVLHVMRQT